MSVPNFKSAILAAMIAAFISGYHSQNYSDLETLGVNCPARDKCAGYRNHLTYMDRSCECDFNCTAYKDCCIDALPNRRSQSTRPAARTDVECMHYGEQYHTGVYVIFNCSNSWNGPNKVRERCLGIVDFSDPFSAAPATDVAQKKTYRNLACAECNNADLASLVTFRLKLKCYGVEDVSQEQIMDDLTYNEEQSLWGVNRLNRFGNATQFYGCSIIFDVPEYLNNSVRFCRSDLISKCATDWTRPVVATQCAQYMAVVYSNTDAYRNPHCAICNHLTVDDVSCRKDILGRQRPPSYPLFLDINRSDGEEVGKISMTTPECPSGRKYDPFFKRCRRLVCALPGYFFVDGKCVKGSD